MLLIPAIDIKDGHCVRLRQGDLTSNITVFNTDPVAQARHWVELGAERLHLVDLDAARSGKPVNLSVIRKICNEFAEDVEIEVGGGMRTLERVGEVLDLGVDYVVIGTAAVKAPGFLHDVCSEYGGSVIVSLDAKDGMVMTDGWTKNTGHSATDLAKKFEGYGVDAILYTDISRDGMLTGCNVEATAELASQLSIPVIASGGIRDLDDIRKLLAVEDDGVTMAIWAALFTRVPWTSHRRLFSRSDRSRQRQSGRSRRINSCSQNASFRVWTSPEAAWSKERISSTSETPETRWKLLAAMTSRAPMN